MSFRLPQGFSLFGGSSAPDSRKSEASKFHDAFPSIKLHADKEVYRPGDVITVTIDIEVPEASESLAEPFFIDNVTFEIKGVEKLDSQWFAIQKPQPGSKLKRGEQLFLDCTTTSLVSKVVVSRGRLKTYLVQAELPAVLPPSYRGTIVRYIYYVKSTLSGQYMALENGNHNGISRSNMKQVEARIPLQIWIMQKGTILLNEKGQTEDLFPVPTIQIDAYWREKDSDSEWVRANDASDVIEEGYDSSRDETSSISSYIPSKSVDIGFRNSVSRNSIAPRYSTIEAQNSLGDQSNYPSYPTLSHLSVAEITEEPSGGILSPQRRMGSNSSVVLSPKQHRAILNFPFSPDDDSGGCLPPGPVDPPTSEGFIRGRSYNIRIDDQVLLRFSPRNSDSTYYFGDMIGGTLTFFHGDGARRCLEVAVTLEVFETISQQYVHPSRRSSPKITKIWSDHHEVVADLVQTSFLFSIPMDGPMSFSTPYFSVQWALRFEFFTTPKNADLTRYEHPLLAEGREKGDWVLPISVSAPPPRNLTAQAKNEAMFSLGSLSVQS